MTCLMLVAGRARARSLLSPILELLPSFHAAILTSASGVGLQSGPFAVFLV